MNDYEGFAFFSDDYWKEHLKRYAQIGTAGILIIYAGVNHRHDQLHVDPPLPSNDVVVEINAGFTASTFSESLGSSFIRLEDIDSTAWSITSR